MHIYFEQRVIIWILWYNIRTISWIKFHLTANFLRCKFYCYIISCLLLVGLTLWWWWSYGSWIYNYLCNHCISPLTLWVRISIRAGCTTLCDKVCQWLTTGWWFSQGPLVSSTNKADRHNISEILFESGVKHHQNKQTNKPIVSCCHRQTDSKIGNTWFTW